MRTVGELGHLARRAWWTLRVSTAVGPAADRPGDDEAWACAWLSGREAALWRAQNPLDRRHTVAVARRVAPAAGAGGPRIERRDAPAWLVPAALLHDVGKSDAPLGLLGRTVATLAELVGVRRAPGALGRYLRYPERGAELLAAAGSRAEVVAWAREHHQPPGCWTLPPLWARVLAAADRA